MTKPRFMGMLLSCRSSPAKLTSGMAKPFGIDQRLCGCAAPPSDAWTGALCCSVGKFGGAESDLEVVPPVASQAHQDQARPFQPVRHVQAADVQRAQSEAGDELHHVRLGARV